MSAAAALARAESALVDLDDALREWDRTGLEVKDRAALWLRLRELAKQFCILRDQLNRELAQAMPTKKVEVPGLGLLERMAGCDRRNWDHQLVASAVLAAVEEQPELRCDPETGELMPIGEALVRWLLEACLPGWRVTGLRQIGLDPDRYCDQVEKPATVILRGET